MRDYIEERAIHIAQYIVDNGATVRQTARQFGVSKSTNKSAPGFPDTDYSRYQ